MKILIDVPEEEYNTGQLVHYFGCYSDKLDLVIYNGTPIDLEGLKSDMKALNCGYPYGLDHLLDCLDKRLGITIPS